MTCIEIFHIFHLRIFKRRLDISFTIVYLFFKKKNKILLNRSMWFFYTFLLRVFLQDRKNCVKHITSMVNFTVFPPTPLPPFSHPSLLLILIPYIFFPSKKNRKKEKKN